MVEDRCVEVRISSASTWTTSTRCPSDYFEELAETSFPDHADHKCSVRNGYGDFSRSGSSGGPNRVKEKNDSRFLGRLRILRTASLSGAERPGPNARSCGNHGCCPDDRQDDPGGAGHERICSPDARHRGCNGQCNRHQPSHQQHNRRIPTGRRGWRRWGWRGLVRGTGTVHGSLRARKQPLHPVG